MSDISEPLFPPLKGYENYPVWVFYMTSWLKTQGLWKYVTGEIPRPGGEETVTADVSPAQTSSAPQRGRRTTRSGASTSSVVDGPSGKPVLTLTEWLRKDAKAKANIGLRVEPSCIPLISQAETAKEMWTKLQNQLSPRVERKIMDLKADFDKVRFNRTELISSQIEKTLVTIRRKLAHLGVSISDKDFCRQVIRSIPPTDMWSSFRMVYFFMLDSDRFDLTAAKIRASVEAEEDRHKIVKAQRRAERKAMIKLRKSRFRSGLFCHACRKEGHFAYECRSRIGVNANRGKGHRR